MTRDLKYLLAYIVPLTAALALLFRGSFAFFTVVVVFVLIPVLEIFFPQSTDNLPQEVSERKASMIFFDWLLYLNIPIVYGLLFYFLHVHSRYPLSGIEIVGLIFSLGIFLGSNGINVAHELGHRDEWYHKVFAALLLLPAMYMHFTIEHNLGHHKNVGTKEDPATARFGEPLYTFWIRSMSMSYINAWKIQLKLLKQNNKAFLDLSNKMMLFTLAQVLWVVGLYSLYGGWVTLYMMIIALVAVLLLETINYIEHYGLMRERIGERYERVRPEHSWNSNHELGRILLYELTRHSDHHYISNKKYQLLDHHDEARQLPFGYPGSMLLSFVPPLWYKIMHRRIEAR